MTDRTLEQIKEHYQIEKALANRLQTSSKADRQHLYTSLYNQLFQQVPHHPQLSRKKDARASAKEVSQKMRLVSQYINADSVFSEVGPRDCQFAFEVAKHTKKVYAVDVSSEIAKHSMAPSNFELIIPDGCTISVDDNTIGVAYSNQLMEHLHLDDALDQLQNLYQVLTPDGVYICITPNRLSGPHDISKYFDEVATGFHLKEYTYADLSRLFKEVGFSKLTGYIGGKGVYVKFPLALIGLFETILNRLPFFIQKQIARTFPVKALLGIILVGTK